MKSGETNNREISTGMCIVVLACTALVSLITAGTAQQGGCTDRQVIGAACLGAGVGLLWALKGIANMKG
jgi:hypothetical protein